MLKRRIPWILVAILFFGWAWEICDDHFSDPYIPSDLAERTLNYLDRSLVLEEAVIDEPEIIQQTLFGSDHEEVLSESRNALESYASENLLDETGLRALAVMAFESGVPSEHLAQLEPGTKTILEGGQPTEVEIAELTSRLSSPDTTWWDAKLAEKVLLTNEDPQLSRALAHHREKSDRLFGITLVSSAIDWLLLISGLFFLPHAWRVIRKGWTYESLHRPVRYVTRWEPSMIIALLLAADLLAGYLLTGVYEATSYRGFVFDVVMDSFWRLFAPVVALIVLFRKPAHAFRALGLDTRPDWKLILAMFSVVSWINFGFGTLVEPWAEFDPTGGLEPMENGLGGLFYGILSACILAPVAEEIFYRGILFRGLLRKFGFWFSSAVVTLAFVLAHSYDFFGLVTIGVFGFAMIVIYRTTGSLTTTIALHALYNFSITLPEWLIYHADR